MQGGIAFSSSSNLTRNPAAPLASGFLVGLSCSLYHSKLFERLNQSKVVLSLPTLNSFLIPGIVSGIMSTVLVAINEDPSANQIGFDRSSGVQAGFQVLGIGLSLAIGSAGGACIGLLTNRIAASPASEYFNDNALYVGEKRPEDSSRFKSFR